MTDYTGPAIALIVLILSAVMAVIYVTKDK